MDDSTPAVEVTVEEATETPTVEVEVEVETSGTTDTDVQFAERITRLEMMSADFVSRSEINNLYTRLDNVEQLSAVNAAVTEVVVEAVEEIVSEPETTAETETETTTETETEMEEAPKSKTHRWWGNR